MAQYFVTEKDIQESHQHYRRIGYVMLGMMLFLLLLGLFFPSDWKERFGILADGISWANSKVPTMRLIAAKSPVADFAQGYLGTMLLLIPFFYIGFIATENFSLRYKMMDLNDPDDSSARFLIAYFFLIPILSALLYSFYDVPFRLNSDRLPRGEGMFSLAISFRFTLALATPVMAMFISVSLWFITILAIWPFSSLFWKYENTGH
ncbi:MAG: hypothetical protein V4495_11205 [Pseudomonadota bacterium]